MPSHFEYPEVGEGGVIEDRMGEEAPPAREAALTESQVRKDPRMVSVGSY